MKKYILTILLIATFGVYVLYARTSTDTSVVGEVPITVPVTTQKPTPTPVPKTGQYKDGTYTGSIADAYYGNIQVETTISEGKVTDVQFLQYPNDRGTSVQINSQAMPMLRSEAIAAQSSNVRIVSGATDSSRAFIQSFGSTLTQAKA